MTTVPRQAKEPHDRAIPALAGVGLRSPHMREVLDTRPSIGWFEVHSENYFGDGIPVRLLEEVRRDYPVSLHGVGLSLGSSDPLAERHLNQLCALARRIEPMLISEHLSWSSVDGRYLNDLLPLPYTEGALDLMVERVSRVQERLQRRILIENISSYLRFRHATISEVEFLSELARRSGCGILLDVNNVYVSASNHGFSAAAYVDAVPINAVAEIHVAGFTRHATEGAELLIDTHNRAVDPEVWALYRNAIQRLGPVPTVVEWDADLPPLAVLLDEAAKVGDAMEWCHALVA